MYAIIRTGGKQAKVHEGDVLDVERVLGDELTFTPLLLVDDKGKVTSDRARLAEARVVARVVGPSAGPKVEIFKYKAKTGYRSRQGHRQKYSRIEITRIEPPGKPSPADHEAPIEGAASAPEAAVKPAAKKPAAKKPAAKKPAAQKSTVGATEDGAAKKPAAKKPAAKKPAAKKPAAKKPATGKRKDEEA